MLAQQSCKTPAGVSLEKGRLYWVLLTHQAWDKKEIGHICIYPVERRVRVVLLFIFVYSENQCIANTIVHLLKLIPLVLLQCIKQFYIHCVLRINQNLYQLLLVLFKRAL